MKKILSLVLAIILTLNVGVFAFATQEDTLNPISKQKAEALAIDFLIHDGCFHSTTLTTYSDNKFYENVPAYEVISTARLKSGELVTYTTYVDLYTGKIYYRTAQFERNIAPLTKKQALEYAYKVLCITEEGTNLLSSKETSLSSYETVYQFTFCKNTFTKYECTISAETGFVDKVSVGTPTNIIERILLLLQVLIARINIFNQYNGSILGGLIK